MMFVVESMTPGMSTLPVGELDVFPHLPLMLMAPVGPHDGHGAWPCLEQQVNDISERYIMVVWCLHLPPSTRAGGPAPPECF